MHMYRKMKNDNEKPLIISKTRKAKYKFKANLYNDRDGIRCL